MATRTIHVGHATNVEPSAQHARESWMLRAAAAGHSHLHVSTLAPRESIALGAFHRRPGESREVAVWRRHTGGRALPTGDGFLLVTLTLPHRSALTSDDRLALAPEQVMNRCVRGVLQALRSIGVDVVYPGLDLLTHERRAIGALTFTEAGGPTLFQVVLAIGRTLSDGAFLLDRVDPNGVVPMTIIPTTEATSLAEVLGAHPSDLAPESLSRQVAAGYAKTFGVEPIPPENEPIQDLPHEADDVSGPTTPAGSGARSVGLLGTVEAWTTIKAGRIDRVVLAGDFLAPPDAPGRLSDALRGRAPLPGEIEHTVQDFLDRDRNYLLGLRPSDLIDLLHRSATVAT